MFFLPLLALALHVQEDPDLARRLKLRDPQAMTDLYDRYGRLAYTLIYRVVRQESVAEDLVQETFLRVWNRIQAFDAERGALGAWVLAVARNRAIDYLRSADGRMSQGSFELDKVESPALFTDLEGDILNIDRVRLLRTAFNKLTPNQRVVLELAYYEGMSQTEMAERLKQPLGTIKTWVRTALKLLRDELGAEGHGMTHEELAGMYELYALGILEAEERAEIDAHLASGCATCAAGLKSAVVLSTALAALPEPVRVPNRLRGKVAASVAVKAAPGLKWLWAAAASAVCLAALAVVFWGQANRASAELASVRRQLGGSTAELARVRTALELVNAPDTEQINFGKGARGRVFVSPARGVLLIASNLPPVPAGRAYEMWVVPKRGAPSPAGVFEPDAQGNALHVLGGPVDRTRTAAIAVTVEPEGGSPAPTTTPLIVAALTE